MKNLVLNAPTFGFIVGTRIALAVGVGLLLSERLSRTRRRAVGAALVALGGVTTFPAAVALLRAARRSGRVRLPPMVERDERLIGATRFPRKGDDL